MRLTMLETRDGSRDGITSETFEKGQSYDFGESRGDRTLCHIFLSEKWAKPAENDGVSDNDAPIDIKSASVEQLRAFLTSKNVDFHPRLGEAKLRAAAVEAVSGE